MVETLTQDSTNTQVRPALSVDELKALIAAASPEVQTEIAVALSRRGNANDAEVMAQVTNVLSAQQAQDVAKEMPGHEHVVAQQVALDGLATAQVEVQQKLASGISADIVKAEAVSEGNVAQAAVVANVVQENKEAERQQQVADSDAAYRLEQGLVEVEQAKPAHEFAHLLSSDLRAAIGAAMGGAQQGQEAETAAAMGGKNPNQRNTGIV